MGLRITSALASGTTGLGVAIDSYKKLSLQLISDVNMIYESIKDIQDQVDSLAEVVLQNRRGLDLLTADKGGICLALQEKCCFYTNKPGIVRDRIRKHQEKPHVEFLEWGFAFSPSLLGTCVGTNPPCLLWSLDL